MTGGHESKSSTDGLVRDFDISINPLSALAKIVGLARWYRDGGISIVHAHQSKGAFIPLVAAAIARVEVIIYHNHGMPYLGYGGVVRAVLKALEMTNVAISSISLTVSPGNREAATQDCLVGVEKIKVLGRGSICGCDPVVYAEDRVAGHRLSVRSRMGVSDQTVVFLYVGRPVRRKGFNDLLDAWRIYSASAQGGAGRELWLAGVSAKDLVAAGGEGLPNVRVLGYVNEVHEMYAAADVVVLPSHHEGLPYALLEGAFSGKALISSSIPGVEGIVIDDVTGLLVPSSDSTFLANAMQRLAGDGALRRRLGSAARNWVRQEFDRGRLLEKYHQFYNQLIEEVRIRKNYIIL